jgi:hypothetical protein
MRRRLYRSPQPRREGAGPLPVAASLARAVPVPQRTRPVGTPPTRHRGGNRLPPGHPARGRPPSYERCRSFGPDPERRDRNQRTRTRRAVALAQQRGQLSPLLAGVLAALLDASDQRLSESWWRLSTIARLVLGAERYGEDKRAGQRTAGRWMAELRELGWVERVHRYEVGRGQLRWTSNLWRFVIPEELRAEVEAVEDIARAKAQARRIPQGRVAPPAASAAQAPPPPQAGPSAEKAATLVSSSAPGAQEPPVDVGAELGRARAALVSALTRASP